MTLAEVDRACESKLKARQRENEQRATYDYILADLIGKSIARIYSSANKMPTISEAYPTLFDKEAEEQMIQDKKLELSAIRFKQFANSYNKRFKGVQNGE